MRTSHSQNSTYIECPMHWYLKYEKKLDSIIEGASTYFGGAVDAAITDLLENKPDYLQTFFNRWKRSESFYGATNIFDNPNIIYSNNDFDEWLVKDEDSIKKLENWRDELGFSGDPIKLFKDIHKIKKNKYKNITDKQLKYFNRASWLSLNKKGEILIKAFVEQFLPKITKVHSTQKRVTIKDPETGDSIIGIIDLVLEIKDYEKPIIFDLKTSARPYDEEKLNISDQLTLYAAMKAKDYSTDLVGYIVLSKNIQKEDVSFCSMCGHIKDGRHKTCNNEINGERCGGEWVTTKKLVPEVQIMVTKKDTNQINQLLGDISNIVFAMKNKIIYKNAAKCSNWYGGPCPYYKYCHNNEDMSNLKIRGK